MDYQLDLIALGTSCLALYFLLRAKKTYFLDSGFFMGIANVGFIILLLDTTVSDITGSPQSQVVTIPLISIMAISIGVASYLLEKSGHRNRGGLKELAEFVLGPPTALVGFLVIVAAWTVSSLLAQPWVLNKVIAGKGNVIYFYSYPYIWFWIASVVLLLSFILLPVRSFYRQALSVTDKKASVSMKILSASWGLFGVITFQTIFLEAFFPLSRSIGLVADSFLFILNSFALREPTILGRIITGGETVSQALYSSLDPGTIVLYNTGSDRRRLIENFVNDGLVTGQDVVCYVTKGEVPFYRAVLKGYGIGTPSKDRCQVIVRPIEISRTNDAPTPEQRSRVWRELVDLDELDLEHSREVVARLGTTEGFLGSDGSGRIWALNVDGASGVLGLLTEKNPRSRVIDLTKQQDGFSSLLNLKHQNILGNRLLLEFEPTTNYEEVVQKFVREFQANVEPVAIFTSTGSPIYRQFRDQRNITLFSFSARTSTPVRLSDEQVLLPERDTSLLLDAVDKLLQTHMGRRVGVVFDVFTDLILSQSFEKAYGVISSVVEMSESNFSSILFLINYAALDERALNGLRGLFRSEVRIDGLGFRAVRLHGSEIRENAEVEDLLPGPERVSRGAMPS